METCTCGHIHTNAALLTLNAVLRQDPSRTSGIVRRFEADVSRRFKRFKAQITQAVVTLDVFGLNPRQHVIQNADLEARQFEFSRSDQKVEGFMRWLQEMEKKGILETSQRPGVFTGEEPWTNTYIQSAYQRGIARAGEELRAKGYAVPEAGGFVPGMSDPIAVAFNQPFHAERVAMLYTRTFSELKGVTAAMDTQISRVLAQGMSEGKSPREIARMMLDRVDKIGITRARTIVRTEIIRAHHQATINTYEQWGASGVTVQAEWLTAGYGVCPQCVSMGGKTYGLAEIRNMIPAHPNCRCCAIPVLKDAPKKKATRTRQATAQVPVTGTLGKAEIIAETSDLKARADDAKSAVRDLTKRFSKVSRIFEENFIKIVIENSANIVHTVDGFSGAPIPHNLVGIFHSVDSKMQINVTGLQNIIKTPQPSFGKWVTDASFTGIVRHEIGHFTHLNLRNLSEIRNSAQPMYYDNKWEKLANNSLNVVSRYGAINLNELFAETFATFTHPGYQGDLPPQLHKFMTEILL